MQKIIPIVLLAVTAVVLLTGQGALASKNVINVTVNCNNGTQAHKQAQSSSNNVNVNVNCASSGGTPGPQGPKGDTGATGPVGKNGQNATVTIITTSNQTGNTTTFSTKHFNCESVVMLPFTCKHK